MRLKVASKSLKGKRVRVLGSFNTLHGDRFAVNEIVKVRRVWRRGVTVRADDGRSAWHVPVFYFELAEDPGPPPAKALPPAPSKRTWVRGKLLILPSGHVSVGLAPLSVVFAKFNEKKVRVSLEVID